MTINRVGIFVDKSTTAILKSKIKVPVSVYHLYSSSSSFSKIIVVESDTAQYNRF